MTDTKILDREVLDEQWYGFMQRVVSQAQERFHNWSDTTGLVQKDVACRLGHKDSTTVSRCLAGQRNMTLRTLHDLARAMDSRLEIAFQPLVELTPSNNQPIRASESVTLSEKNGGSSHRGVYLYSDGAPLSTASGT